MPEAPPKPIPNGDLELQRILRELEELSDVEEPGLVSDEMPYSPDPPRFEIKRRRAAPRRRR